MEPGCSQGRPLVPHIYVNSFGSHRCGSLIRCGRGYKWADAGQSRILLSQQNPMDRRRGQRAAKARGDKADPKPSGAAGRAQAVESCGGVKDTSLCRVCSTTPHGCTLSLICTPRLPVQQLLGSLLSSPCWELIPVLPPCGCVSQLQEPSLASPCFCFFSTSRDDLQKEKPDTFDFPCPSRKVEKVIKRKKKKYKVWIKVWKVISKMLEENEKFRSRLSACSQFNGEGNDMKQSSQNETFSLDREESIFGWV
ncbi:uncharacterized protein C5orf47 homolog [Anas acuta]|uniref:uncharacterized protein C5orf47 homolog n=1 Tax=Anas acuta TaxID=28680 RepID=UPI0035C894BD